MDWERVATWVVLVGAAFTVLGHLARKARNVARKLDRLEELLRPAAKTVAKELTPNTGSSMKDDLHGMAVSLGEAQRRLDDLETGQEGLAAGQRRHGLHLADIDRRVTQHLKEWDQ
jgi:hypothetical protein